MHDTSQLKIIRVSSFRVRLRPHVRQRIRGLPAHVVAVLKTCSDRTSSVAVFSSSVGVLLVVAILCNSVQFYAVLLQLCCISGAVLVQLCCSCAAVLVQFWCSSGAVLLPTFYFRIFFSGSCYRYIF